MNLREALGRMMRYIYAVDGIRCLFVCCSSAARVWLRECGHDGVMADDYQRSFEEEYGTRLSAGRGSVAGVVTDAERAAVGNIRLRALLWIMVFLIVLGTAIAAGTDRSGGPAQGEQVTAVVTNVDTRKNSVTVSAHGSDYPFRHRTKSVYSYHVGEQLQLYLFNGEAYESLQGVTNLTPLGKAYPWLACAAFALAVVALTYLVGWRRAAAVVRDSDAGDPIAIAYLKRGPQLGSVEWWWATPPVRPKAERRKVVAMGVVFAVAAAAFMVMEMAIWLLDKPAGVSSILVAAPFASVPFLALAVWCFLFAAHPTERLIRMLGRVRWGLLAIGLIGLLVTGMVAQDFYAGGLLAAVYVTSHTFIQALRALATTALPGPVTMPRYREEIERDVARRAQAESQVASEGWGLEMVRAKRERRMFLRYTLISIGLIACIALATWAKLQLGL